jgi:hypothetical protein
MYDQVLRDKFKFDEADLNANRNGRVTEKQQKNLSENIKKTRIIGFGVGCCLLVLASFLPFVAILISLVAWKENYPSPALGLLGIGIPNALI